MKLFDRAMDWLEARPLWQMIVGIAMAFALLVIVGEVIR